ncbi:MAG: P-loop NTPase [Planctomycetota bacterium]
MTSGVFRRLFERVAPHDAPEAAEAGVVAVASGKGGTGKSFFATSLAIELSQSMRVVLVDCDYGLGSDHLLLGTSPRTTLRDVIAGRVPAVEALVDTVYGPALLPGGSGVSAMVEMADAELAALAHALGELAGQADQLVLDLGAGISPQVVLTLLAAHQIVLVTNPDIAALTDAYALVKCLARQATPPPIGVVVNRVTGGDDMGARTFAKLADVARRFSGSELHYLGDVPDDPVVTQRRLGQAPLVASHPQCAVATAIAAIARRLHRFGGGLGRRPMSPRSDLASRWRSLIPRRRHRF